jgi:hypothetical protein
LNCSTYLRCGGCFSHSLLIFINYIFFFISFSLGIFRIYGNLSFSSVTNSTFTNITSLYGYTYSGTDGGAIYISTPDYSFFTINGCIFTQCKAYYVGALFLFSIPYIYISHTRFENNDAYANGDDIFVIASPCFNKAMNDTLDSSVCSTTPLGDRVYCRGGGYSCTFGIPPVCSDDDSSHPQNNCSNEVV